MILYNVPSRTGVSFTAESYKVLAQNPKINGVKEASGNFSLLAHTRFLCPDDFYIWSGNDDQVVPMMSLGAKGGHLGGQQHHPRGHGQDVPPVPGGTV